MEGDGNGRRNSDRDGESNSDNGDNNGRRDGNATVMMEMLMDGATVTAMAMAEMVGAMAMAMEGLKAT